MGVRRPNFTLKRGVVSQRQYELRELFNVLRWIIRAGVLWRTLHQLFILAAQGPLHALVSATDPCPSSLAFQRI